MEALLQDIRFGLRALIKRPGFTLVSVLALALGIGSNTAIFSVVNGVLLRPLPVTEPDRLVQIIEVQPSVEDASISAPDYRDWEAQLQSYEQLAAYISSSFKVNGPAGPERLTAAISTAGFFRALGAKPELGRTYGLEDKDAPVVVLSHSTWSRLFGADPKAIGKTLVLNNETVTVIGVMPSDVKFPLSVDLWRPASDGIPLLDSTGSGDMRQSRGSHFLQVIGRLKPGVTVEHAQSEIQTLMAQLAKQYPDSNEEHGARVLLLHERLVGKTRPTLWMLLGAVAFVLLIACANVANLLLARAASRQKEIAVRAALGASRRQIVRQLLAESLLLALLGGAAGLLLSFWGLDLMVVLGKGSLPRTAEVSVDLRVLAFTLFVSAVTGVGFGLVPALMVSRVSPQAVLKEGSGTAGGSRGRFRGALVVTEVALALVLLAGAGLFIRSFQRLQAISPGFNPEGVLSMRLSLSPAEAAEPQRVTAFYREVVQRAASVPGVRLAGAVGNLPMGGSNVNGDFSIAGRPEPTGPSDTPFAEKQIATPDYFRVMEIPLLQGRLFTEQDSANAPGVVLVNQALVKKYFPGEDPIGKRLANGTGEEKRLEIVGVVGDVRQRGPGVAAAPEIYFAPAQQPWPSMSLVVRTQGEPGSVANALRKEIATIGSGEAVYSVKPMEEVLAATLAARRFTLVLLLVFASVALLMAVVGIYGVMAFSVAQRTNEIGVRMALGARPGNVVRMVMRGGMRLALMGVGIGGAMALGLMRATESMLYQAPTFDFPTLGLVALILTAAAMAACYVPARRATQVDPQIAIRAE